MKIVIQKFSTGPLNGTSNGNFMARQQNRVQEQQKTANKQQQQQRPLETS